MKENEIRPREIFEEYLRLSSNDAKKLDHSVFVTICCPACDSADLNHHLKKNGFQFDICLSCGTLFCNPRPTQEQMNEFYSNSESSRYWAEVFFPSVAEKRREKLFKKKAKKIKDIIDTRCLNPQSICDVGAGYGILLEELRAILGEADYSAIEPSPILAGVCRDKGVQTLVKSAENADEWQEKFDLVICSEVIEHTVSPLDFVSSIYKLIKKDGIAIITGLGYEGFDILMLQDRSKSISPPHHIDFMSIKGFEILFQRAGFCEIEVQTPGELDVDIVLNSEIDNEFIRVLGNRGEETIKRLQKFLTEERLSSHVWCIAKK